MKHFHIILAIWYRSAAEEWVRLKLFPRVKKMLNTCRKLVKPLIVQMILFVQGGGSKNPRCNFAPRFLDHADLSYSQHAHLLGVSAVQSNLSGPKNGGFLHLLI